MLRLKRLSVINVITFSLSLAFVLPAKEAQTVTISDNNLVNKQEVLKRKLLTQLKQKQEFKGSTQLVAQRQERIALVIGNAAYQEDPLANPVNDATDVAQALRELGFKVTLLNNLNWQEMDESIENFSKQLSQGAVGLFYYAGHGVQVDGENYLIPLDAQLKRERDVRREAVPLGDVLKFMEEAESQVSIVIIDACRDNPFYRQWHSTRGSTSVRGLSQVDLPPEGTIIAFATAPGYFAEDGAGQRNSPFTSNLLKYISTPKLEVADMFRKVREEVYKETDELQRPWYRESLIGSFFFKPIEEESTPSPQTSTNSNTATVTQPTSDPTAEDQQRQQGNLVFNVKKCRHSEGFIKCLIVIKNQSSEKQILMIYGSDPNFGSSCLVEELSGNQSCAVQLNFDNYIAQDKIRGEISVDFPHTLLLTFRKNNYFRSYNSIQLSIFNKTTNKPITYTIPNIDIE